MRQLFFLLMLVSQPVAALTLQKGECVMKRVHPFAVYHVVEVVDQDYYVVREILDGREYNRDFALFFEEVSSRTFRRVGCPTKGNQE